MNFKLFHRFFWYFIASNILITLSNAEKLQETEIYACMSKYLKSEDRRFKLKSNEVASETECESYLAEYRNGFYTEINKDLKSDEDLEENAECLIVQLKKLFLAETSMKKLIYENSKKMSRKKRKKALRAIDYSIEKKMETAVMLCTTEEVFGELFEVLYSNANETESNESEDKQEEDYCHRKYIVDRNFINTTVYNVTLNPGNIDTSDLKCEQIVEQSINETEDELKDEFVNGLERPSKQKRKCITKTIRTHQYFEHSVKVIIFGEIGLSEDNKLKERLNFVKQMKSLYESIINC